MYSLLAICAAWSVPVFWDKAWPRALPGKFKTNSLSRTAAPDDNTFPFSISPYKNYTCLTTGKIQQIKDE